MSKLILKTDYTNYSDALKKLKLDRLDERRSKLALKFAKGCTKLDEMKDLFRAKPQSKYDMRPGENYDVKYAATTRLQNSAVPAMQRILNNNL